MNIFKEECVLIEDWLPIVISVVSLIISIIAIIKSIKYAKVTIKINKTNEKCKYIIELCNKFSLDDIMNEVRSYRKELYGDQQKSLRLLNYINKEIDLCLDAWMIYRVFFDCRHKEEMDNILKDFMEIAFSNIDNVRYYKKLNEIPDLQTWALDIVDRLKNMRSLFHSQLNDYYDDIERINDSWLRKIINNKRINIGE